jgi:hypothetical protein
VGRGLGASGSPAARGGSGVVAPSPKDRRFGGGEGDDDVAWWDPRVGKGNRETAGANCLLGMQIF